MNKKVCFVLLALFIVLVLGAVIAVIVVLVKDKGTNGDNNKDENDTGVTDANNNGCGSLCASNSTCVNTPGGYTCVCNVGFTGNGTFCRALQCPPRYSLIVDSCYTLSPGTGAFSNFESTDCNNLNGGYLVEFEDIDENIRVASFFKIDSTTRPYIGGQLISGIWKWFRNETSMSFTNWNVGEPSGMGYEKCIHLASPDGKWNDLACYTHRRGICEVEPW